MTIDRSRRARAARKRRRRFLAADNDLTPAQWTAIRAAWGGCAYCGELDAALQKDCVLPLSRGGRYTVENVVPACRSCNASKSNDEVTGWLRRKRLDEPRFLLRWAEIVIGLRTQLSESEDVIDLSSTITLDSES
jgi:5-methylcytosine-specific restriction endonuclease McrA